MATAQQLVRFIPFGLPVITIATALPLALQKVPPNLWYGFRTRRTLSDPNVWYRANYLGGMDLLYSGIVALIVNLILSVTLDPVIALPIQCGVVVISSMFALVFWSVQMRNL